MADNFQSTKIIRLQPASDGVPYTFTFAACTSATANDGSIPYGSTISSAAVKAFDEAGDDKTAEIVSSSSSSDLVVTVYLDWPATTGAGRYSLEIVLTLSSGVVMEFDFTRLHAEDITA